MAKGLVLLTGATGFIGFRTLLYLLEHKYNVRIVVRSEAKAKTLKSSPELKNFSEDAYEFVVVPDLLAPGALDKAATGVESVVHLASPIPLHGDIPPERQHDELIVPAIRGTLGALESAKKAGSVKRVVITSSAVAVIPWKVVLPTGEPPSDETFSGDSRAEEIESPFPNAFVAYTASKVAALNASDAWVKKEKPSFDIVNIMPGYVIGGNRLATTTAQLLDGTNAVFLAMVTGKTHDTDMPPELGLAVHVDDVALVHVLALDREKIKTNGIANYLMSNDIEWNNITKATAKLYPEAVKDGTLSNDGTKLTKPGKVDHSAVEKDFGIKLKSLDDMVKGVVGQYLELLRKETGTDEVGEANLSRVSTREANVDVA